jgi:hypothetical protein
MFVDDKVVHSNYLFIAIQTGLNDDGEVKRICHISTIWQIPNPSSVIMLELIYQELLPSSQLFSRSLFVSEKYIVTRVIGQNTDWQ